jgi:hypothetical protein
VQDEDPATDRLELLVEVRGEPAGARVEECPGDVTEFSVVTVEQGERVAGLVGIDQGDVHVADVGSARRSAAVVDVGGDMPRLGRVVGAEPPGMLVPVGEGDAPWAGWRGVAGFTDHADTQSFSGAT